MINLHVLIFAMLGHRIGCLPPPLGSLCWRGRLWAWCGVGNDGRGAYDTDGVGARVAAPARGDGLGSVDGHGGWTRTRERRKEKTGGEILSYAGWEGEQGGGKADKRDGEAIVPVICDEASAWETWMRRADPVPRPSSSSLSPSHTPSHNSFTPRRLCIALDSVHNGPSAPDASHPPLLPVSSPRPPGAATTTAALTRNT